MKIAKEQIKTLSFVDGITDLHDPLLTRFNGADHYWVMNHWISKAEAAKKAGISETAMRTRVACGLRGYQLIAGSNDPLYTDPQPVMTELFPQLQGWGFR